MFIGGLSWQTAPGKEKFLFVLPTFTIVSWPLVMLYKSYKRSDRPKFFFKNINNFKQSDKIFLVHYSTVASSLFFLFSSRSNIRQEVAFVDKVPVPVSTALLSTALNMSMFNVL